MAAKKNALALASETKKDGGILHIPPLHIVKTVIRVQGIEPVITHRFAEKARKVMLDKKQQKAKVKRPPCNPEEEFLAARYVNEKGEDCLPTIAFKCAITDAASFVEGVTKVAIRGAVFIRGELVKLNYKKRVMREDVVRVGMGAADLRFRPEYHDWWVDLPVEFNPNIISAEQLHHLVQLAGFSVGVAEWRPQKDGQFGRFELAGASKQAAE